MPKITAGNKIQKIPALVELTFCCGETTHKIRRLNTPFKDAIRKNNEGKECGEGGRGGASAGDFKRDGQGKLD